MVYLIGLHLNECWCDSNDTECQLLIIAEVIEDIFYTMQQTLDCWWTLYSLFSLNKTYWLLHQKYTEFNIFLPRLINNQVRHAWVCELL